MKNRSLFNLIEMGLYAALIFIAITAIRIPMPTGAFVHPGNALVVLSVLLMGTKRGMIASVLGLSLFDLLNGYAASVPFTILENVIVMLIVSVLFFKGMKGRDNVARIGLIGVVGAISKIILVFIKYVFRQLVIGSALPAAITVASAKMPASFMTGIVTAILVTILYPLLKRIIQHYHPIGQ